MMDIIIEQWKNKLAVVEKFEKAGDAAQVNQTMSPKDRDNQVRICRDQVLRGREEMDLIVDRMTDEQRKTAGNWFERHRRF